MKVETKLDFDDVCYFIDDNRIKKGNVEKIEIIVGRDYHFGPGETNIIYTIKKDNAYRVLHEEEVFETLEKALRYLEESVEW